MISETKPSGIAQVQRLLRRTRRRALVKGGVFIVNLWWGLPHMQMARSNHYRSFKVIQS